jgi:uncharacterized protein YegL
MLRSLKPSRSSKLKVAIQTAISFIQTKFIIDSKDRISLITFGDNIKKLSSFTYDENDLFNSLKRIQISGKGQLHQAIAFSLQTIVQELRKIGGKVQRIFIISDNKLDVDEKKIEKIINIAKGLNVYIDICQIGILGSDRQTYLKRISEITGGVYGSYNNIKTILNAAGDFASKKEAKTIIDYSLEKKDTTPPLISEIALKMRRPSLMEIRLMMSKGGGEDKCAVCHSIKAPLTDADFFAEGRYCPNCDRPLHLSCATMWAKKSSEKNENVFRCPFCFFLLELPKSAKKLMETINMDSQKVKILDVIEKKKAKLIEIHETMVDTIDASCSYCYNIFLGDFTVYECGNCGSYYHEPCLKKMYNEMKACRFCGAEIIY